MMGFKQKDIALIIVVTVVSGIVSFYVSNILFGSTHRSTQVEVVEKLDDTFTNPDPKYFNNKSINPTQLIRIGDNTNKEPFQSAN
ncbi:MAG TPA: hypothetical protein VLF39_03580 [Candidatus Saccharimonadales bacterium]|nr:hypothetical protein [Candidatus Saccharimonadales bacterium]